MNSDDPEVLLVEFGQIAYAMPWQQRLNDSRRRAFETYERRASQLANWKRRKACAAPGSVIYEVKRTGMREAEIIVEFRYLKEACIPPAIRVAGHFSGSVGHDEEDLACQLQMVLGSDFDHVAQRATLQCLAAKLFVNNASLLDVEVTCAEGETTRGDRAAARVVDGLVIAEASGSSARFIDNDGGIVIELIDANPLRVSQLSNVMPSLPTLRVSRRSVSVSNHGKCANARDGVRWWKPRWAQRNIAEELSATGLFGNLDH